MIIGIVCFAGTGMTKLACDAAWGEPQMLPGMCISRGNY